MMAPFFHVVPMHRWSGLYPVRLFRKATSDWYVHLDEDAFAYRPEAIGSIIDFMERHGYVCAGMPDGGVVSIRFHNPVACNPFFLVVHRRALDAVYSQDPKIECCDWDEKFKRYTAPIVGQTGAPFAYDDFEPFYCFFYWLCKHGAPILYLRAKQWSEEPESISTMLCDQVGEPFLLHSWYSRQYIVRERAFPWLARMPKVQRWLGSARRLRGAHYDRIRRVIDYALRLRSAQQLS
jgi:hypothetical protein